MEEFGRTQASLAEAVGKSRSHVANTMRLLSLPAPVRRRLDDGELSAGHARALLVASDPVALAAEIVRRGLNVRATEKLVQRRSAMPLPSSPLRDADTMAFERELGTALGLRVTLEKKKRGGRLTLHYTEPRSARPRAGLVARRLTACNWRALLQRIGEEPEPVRTGRDRYWRNGRAACASCEHRLAADRLRPGTRLS